MLTPPGDALHMHPPIRLPSSPSQELQCSPFQPEDGGTRLLSLLSQSRLILLAPPPSVTADLLGWFSAIWRYTKSHYSVGHGLDKGGLIKESPHSPHASWGGKRWRTRRREGGLRGEVPSDAFDL